MSVITSNKSGAVQMQGGKGQGVSEGFSGFSVNGGAARFGNLEAAMSGMSEVADTSLSQALASSSGKASYTVDGEGNGVFTDKGHSSYNTTEDSIYNGIKITTVHGRDVTDLSQVDGSELVRVGGVEMPLNVAMAEGLVTQEMLISTNPDQEQINRETELELQEAVEITEPYVRPETTEGINSLSEAAGELVDGLILDCTLSTFQKDFENAEAYIDMIHEKMPSGTKRNDVVDKVQAVVTDTLKAIRKARGKGAIEYATQKLQKMDYGEARSIVTAIMYGDRGALNRLMK